MGVVAVGLGVLAGLGGAAVVVVLAAMAAAGRIAAAGREQDGLLVAPRGAGFGVATRSVARAAGRAGSGPGDVVHLHEHRGRRRADPAHEAA